MSSKLNELLMRRVYLQGERQREGKDGGQREERQKEEREKTERERKTGRRKGNKDKCKLLVSSLSYCCFEHTHIHTHCSLYTAACGSILKSVSTAACVCFMHEVCVCNV